MRDHPAPKCFFCGGDLAATAPKDRYRCGKCGADFRSEKDAQGCVLRLEVVGCGAEECCRHRKDSRPS